MNDHLSIAMSAAVPVHIMELEAAGGPTDADWAFARKMGQRLAEHGDKLLFRNRKEGETADLFNDTAKAIAILAFVPGGISIFGNHWDARNGKEKSTTEETP